MKFLELIVALDILLTGKSRQECQQAERNQPWAGNPDDWYFGGSHGIYYLSDGGFTRLRFSQSQGKLVVILTASPQRNEAVSALWNSEDAQSLRARIEARITENWQ